jgi:hypothetical protein
MDLIVLELPDTGVKVSSATGRRKFYTPATEQKSKQTHSLHLKQYHILPSITPHPHQLQRPPIITIQNFFSIFKLYFWVNFPCSRLQGKRLFVKLNLLCFKPHFFFLSSSVFFFIRVSSRLLTATTLDNHHHDRPGHPIYWSYRSMASNNFWHSST